MEKPVLFDFDSPEDAAMYGFPARYCRVVASRTHGDDAYVLLDTGPSGHPYLYGVFCSGHEGRWRGAGSGNGPAWETTDLDRQLGTPVVWGELPVPAGADRVRLEFQGDVVEEPVIEGMYLAAWWRVPCPEFDWPDVVGLRIDGGWTAV